ncbi:uncharacterized protein CIMG_12988 [Coccidioides immitis RS]|uniref:Uncharacterized protein n=1 Tax=Coccidioides immitis (strain RS) TaxID=246410 RepID=A0A0D8JSZ4_COCIM|nr:uncharacterized protein CIMG_12988 [Coccidioides immitis RS]KJF60470.1 hypothetical protein CIMG_12988 [Coccidioides immitis RS]
MKHSIFAIGLQKEMQSWQSVLVAQRVMQHTLLRPSKLINQKAKILLSGITDHAAQCKAHIQKRTAADNTPAALIPESSKAALQGGDVEGLEAHGTVSHHGLMTPRAQDPDRRQGEEEKEKEERKRRKESSSHLLKQHERLQKWQEGLPSPKQQQCCCNGPSTQYRPTRAVPSLLGTPLTSTKDTL